MKENTHRFIVTLLVVVPLLSTVFAMTLLWKKMFFAEDLILLGVFYVLTGIGVAVGYHRMLTHQSFEAPSWLRGLLLMLGCMA
ncbi:MAG: acyl-CoA desaturase, partial [Patescibacteria group bacterium]